MRLTAIILARVFVPIVVDELNPRGRAFNAEAVNNFIQKLGFITFPKMEELLNLDDQKGIAFQNGRWDDTAIEELVLYPNGIAVDTRASTDVSESVIREVISWVSENMGAVFQQESINRKFYLSQVNFISEIPLTTLNPRFIEFSERLTKSVTSSTRQQVQFEPYGINFHFDLLTSKLAIPKFVIERLADVPFSDNKYFSSAPLPTDEHIQLLEDFEAALIEATK